MRILSESLKDYGFESEAEFTKMVCDVDLTQTITFMRFNYWKTTDGTKKGLQKVLEEQKQRDKER